MKKVLILNLSEILKDELPGPVNVIALHFIVE